MRASSHHNKGARARAPTDDDEYSDFAMVLRQLTAQFQQLQPRQLAVVREAGTLCMRSCALLHPIDQEQAAACVAACQDKHRELFTLENASSALAVGAVVLLFIIAAYTLLGLRKSKS